MTRYCDAGCGLSAQGAAGRADPAWASGCGSVHARWFDFVASDAYVWLLGTHRLLATLLAPPPRRAHPLLVTELLTELRWEAWEDAELVYPSALSRPWACADAAAEGQG